MKKIVCNNAIIISSPKKTNSFVTWHLFGKEQLFYENVADKNYFENSRKLLTLEYLLEILNFVL